jgi:two-component system chemotaxis sensor kinase CheA
MNSDELHQQLMEAFRAEAKERIESLFANLTVLERTAQPENQRQALEIIYREAHSLKGAARSVSITPIESLCQSLEEIFNQIKEGKLAVTRPLFDNLHEATGMIEKFIFSSESSQQECVKIMNRLIASFNAFKGDPVPINACEKDPSAGKDSIIAETSASEPPCAISPTAFDAVKPGIKAPDGGIQPNRQVTAGTIKIGDTVRISSAKLDSLLLKAEELIVVKQILHQHLAGLKQTNESLRNWKSQSKRAEFKLKASGFTEESHGVLHRFYQLVATNRAHTENVSAALKQLTGSLEQNHRMLAMMVDDLLEEVKNTSLLPFSSLFSILPRMVRDIAREQEKEIDIEISGGDIEIDKRILEAVKDPVIHLVRNAVDHGIEMPEKRKRTGKQPWGTIRIAVTQPENRFVQMTIEDDGYGIPVEALKNRAVGKGIISSEYAESMTDEQALALIFQSGISTSPIITEISGRGLGMAIVKEIVETLGGAIRIENAPGHGTAFHITLPVTLATLRGILIAVSGHLFILPNAHVEHIVLINPDEIKTAENRTVVHLNGSVVSWVKMADLLELDVPPKTDTKKRTLKAVPRPAVLLRNGDTRIAVSVDAIINEQEVLLKNLGKQIRRVPLVSGATILSTGKVVPVLNAKNLIIKASTTGLKRSAGSLALDSPAVQAKSILVVEDSFTSRTLLKNILEASGYSVQTAVDGEDGFSRLKTGLFDAVVSDIQMPKMDGFKLTQKIRNDKSLSHLPVILVTSLDSPADKEKGIDVGANAYIVKTSFDQSNLLDVLERLV